MSELVRIENLVKQFGPIRAVDGVSFSVGRGEVLGFLGPNGAGKSTTMKIVTGFLAPDEGRVSVGGADVAVHPIAAKRCIGYLPEGAPLYSDMTTRAFLDFTAGIRGFRGGRRIGVWPTRWPGCSSKRCSNSRSRPCPRVSSAGVGLAQAILHDPEVLVLDEPTDGLDPNQKHEVRALIREMAPRKAIILSTHLLEEVDAVCSRAVIISAGRIVSDGAPEALHARAGDHNAVTLVLRDAAPERVRPALLALEGVAAVDEWPDGTDGGDGDEDEARGGGLRLRVRSKGGRPIAAEVSRAARERGWRIEALTVDRGRLEDVFRALTAPDHTRS